MDSPNKTYRLAEHNITKHTWTCRTKHMNSRNKTYGLAKHNIRLRQTKDTDSPLWRSRCTILLEQGVHMGISSLPFGFCTLFNV